MYLFSRETENESAFTTSETPSNFTTESETKSKTNIGYFCSFILAHYAALL